MPPITYPTPDTSSPSVARRRVCLAAAAWAMAPSLAAASPVLRIGVTPVVPEDRVGLLRRWAAYLSDAMGREVRLEPYAVYQRVLDALEHGELDAAWLCGYPYVLYRTRLRMVAVPLWRGQPYYQGYVIAREGSPWQSLASLRGRTFAYADPLSNSGYLVVQHALRAMGEDPAQFFGQAFFTHAHRHVIEAVHSGLADAGAVDGYVWELLRTTAPARVRGTRVVWQSEQHGFPPIVCAAQVGQPTVLALQHALLAMERHPEGIAILAALHLDRFVRGDPRWYSSIEQMVRGQA